MGIRNSKRVWLVASAVVAAVGLGGTGIAVAGADDAPPAGVEAGAPQQAPVLPRVDDGRFGDDRFGDDRFGDDRDDRFDDDRDDRFDDDRDDRFDDDRDDRFDDD